MPALIKYNEIRETLEKITTEIEEIAVDDREFQDDAQHARDVCDTFDDASFPEKAKDAIADAFERVFDGVLDIATRIETMRDVRMSTADEIIEKLCGDRAFTINTEHLAADVFLTVDVIMRMFWTRFNATEGEDG